ncbi:hypothetical protein GCM10027445_10520 [Amycolatopsis endophytica]|uniref:Ketosteroid isomerase-like protein n=1 Tax=Amycolatopsis endophytica TaxID=860233 RepID=A0A853AX81_9PSEU|nr:nuclear transport factor 2 family protein [Amycolatopsis endophytica]NYI87288.1 ketosteroid isomerase-like protein [Amycolatopsis endophytica]
MAVGSDAVLDGDTRRAIEALSTEYSWLVDHGSADRAAELFTEDAILSTGDRVVSGIIDIRRHLEERARNRDIRSRHVVSNTRLRAESPGRVRGSIILTVYRRVGDAGIPQVVVADVEDRYRLGDDGHWRIAERTLTPAFVIGEF